MPDEAPIAPSPASRAERYASRRCAAGPSRLFAEHALVSASGTPPPDCPGSSRTAASPSLTTRSSADVSIPRPR